MLSAKSVQRLIVIDVSPAPAILLDLIRLGHVLRKTLIFGKHNTSHNVRRRNSSEKGFNRDKKERLFLLINVKNIKNL